MKKWKTLCMLLVLFTLSTASVLAESHKEWVGPNNSLKFYWYDSTGVSGDYVYAELEGYGSYKKAYAECGENGTWSHEAGPTDSVASVTDWGPFGTAHSQKNASYSFR